MNPEDIPQPDMVGDHTETYSGEIVATKKNGIKVPVKFEFTYPRGEGMTAMQVVNEFGDLAGGNNFLQHLINTGDDSLLAAAARMRDTDDEDEFEDYLDDEDDYDENED